MIKDVLKSTGPTYTDNFTPEEVENILLEEMKRRIVALGYDVPENKCEDDVETIVYGEVNFKVVNGKVDNVLVNLCCIEQTSTKEEL